MLMLALLIELVLFAFHLHGREVMDKHVHMLLVYAIMACIASVAAEIVYPRSVTAAIARSALLTITYPCVVVYPVTHLSVCLLWFKDCCVFTTQASWSSNPLACIKSLSV